MKDLKNKIAVVTGAGSGIGKSLAIQLAKEGAKVAISDIDEISLQETYLYISQINGKEGVFQQTMDVSKKEEMTAFAEKVLSTFRQVDIVINNAGVALGRVDVKEVSYEDFEWIVGINMWGMIYGTKAFLPHLLERPEASIINISSVFGIIGVAYQAPYCTTKFAIRGFTESLRMEMQEHPNVHVGVVHPGGIKTNIVRNSRWTEELSEDVREKQMQNFEKTFRTTADQAAATIIKGIKKKSPRIMVGGDSKLLDSFIRWMPARYTGWAYKVFKRLEVE